jgi:hypothetical protein
MFKLEMLQAAGLRSNLMRRDPHYRVEVFEMLLRAGLRANIMRLGPMRIRGHVKEWI